MLASATHGTHLKGCSPRNGVAQATWGNQKPAPNMPPTKTAPHVLRPMNVSRLRIKATKASGHHPSAGNAPFIAIPPSAATGIAALSDSTGEVGVSFIVWRDVGL